MEWNFLYGFTIFFVRNILGHDFFLLNTLFITDLFFAHMTFNRQYSSQFYFGKGVLSVRSGPPIYRWTAVGRIRHNRQDTPVVCAVVMAWQIAVFLFLCKLTQWQQGPGNVVYSWLYGYSIQLRFITQVTERSSASAHVRGVRQATDTPNFKFATFTECDFAPVTPDYHHIICHWLW